MKHTLGISLLVTAAVLSGCPKSVPESRIGTEWRFGDPDTPRQEYRTLITPTRSATWKTPYGEGVRVDSRHYHLFTLVTDVRTRRLFPAFMEAAHDNYHVITSLPRRPVGKRMPLYLTETREQWADLTRHELKDKARDYLAIQTGGYCHRGVGVFWRLPGTTSYSVAAHEGLHQFFHYRMRNTLPAWLEEGLCTLTEGFQTRGAQAIRFTPEENQTRAMDLRAAIIDDRWIPLRRLLNMDAGDAIVGGQADPLAYYGQVWALAMYLRFDKRYHSKLKKLLTDAEAGRFHEVIQVPADKLADLQLRGKAYNRTVSTPVFVHYVSTDIPAFEKELREYAEKLVKITRPKIDRRPYGVISK